MKHLLIVYHSQTGNTLAMAQAVRRGSTSPEIENVETRFLQAADAGVEDLLWANALLIGTPENFGYMSGAIKDFLDRTYYPCEGKTESLPYAVFISAGNDGTGALSSIARIAKGYPFREVQKPIICIGEITEDTLQACETLGLTIAAGLEMGIY